MRFGRPLWNLAQNDGSIAVGVIIDGKAERIAEVAQLKIVVSPML